MPISPNTPILIGVGQITEQVPQDLTLASSNTDLAAKAVSQAFVDAGVEGLNAQVDTVVAVRTFADSSPTYRSKLGGPDNFPRAIAKRVGLEPKRAVYSQVGGDTPQRLVNEFAEQLFAGEAEMVLLVGAEVLANIKAISKAKLEVDWSEQIGGQVEDRGMSAGRLITGHEIIHQIVLPMQYYGLMENARRAASEQSVAAYEQEMGQTFSQLAAIAAENPLAMDQTPYTAEEIITVNERNPLLITPYTKRLIAKDRVNQAAALVMTTVAKAQELGVPQEKWVFLHAYTQASERVLLERPQLGHSPALVAALKGALAQLDKSAVDIQHFDLYSCFPIVVHEARDILQIAAEDPRPLSQTGGLPYFGGPGNNYSMHGIAALVDRLRQDRGSHGLVLANGGWMSKLAVGIYSTAAVEDWQPQTSATLQQELDAEPYLEIEPSPDGEAVLDSYIVHYFKGFPVKAIIVGRLKANNKRFYATTPMADTETVQALLAEDPIGKTIYVETDPKSNRFAFSSEQLAKYAPKEILSFKEKYQFCTVERRGRILLVTINRPEVRNALHPPANDELEGIFNAYERDPDLRVAIITGTGEQAFSTGNDLKYMAKGNPIWISKTGFGGLTSRVQRVKPIIAALNGTAAGGGLEMALACDIVVAADHAKLGLPEVNVGLFAGAGGIQRLTRQIGTKKAMEMLLTGRLIDAAEALEAGLVNYVLPAGDVLDKALALAQQIADASPVGVRSTMRVLNEIAHLASTDDAVTEQHTVFDELINSDDFWEGARAFAEKREPRWRRK
ncbi:MAG: enoyl-CoA hydratase-related protein [Bacteroidota bacterium]